MLMSGSTCSLCVSPVQMSEWSTRAVHLSQSGSDSCIAQRLPPNWAFLIGLDRRITRWAGRPNLGCFKKTKNRPISCFFLHFYLSHVILICSSSKYHSKIMFSAVINSFFLNAALFGLFEQRLVNQFTLFSVGEMWWLVSDWVLAL